MIEADRVHSTPRLSASSIPLLEDGLAVQQRERRAALRKLAALRKEATTEISRLIAFLDASDPYVMSEREEECEDEGAQCEGGGGEEGCEDEGGDRSDYEPSLGSIERHPSVYGPDGRNWTGDQIAWAASGTKDLEDEHDGAEPGEDDEPWLGWTTSGVIGTCLTDREKDDCDRESNEPLLTECV
ncbi:hypothetical protein [Bradyrhizobium japonicum]|uniref:hypothetical protein n=1 Tax=Bradyrhizobium japonicum TaxID=375 RepID=UPI0004876D79|nr:hypothetical protein [Bradyrhizobium japonicum]